MRLFPERIAITFKVTQADRLACLPTLRSDAEKLFVPKLDLDTTAQISY